MRATDVGIRLGGPARGALVPPIAAWGLRPEDYKNTKDPVVGSQFE